MFGINIWYYAMKVAQENRDNSKLLMGIINFLMNDDIQIWEVVSLFQSLCMRDPDDE